MQKRKSGNLILYAAVILIILFAIAAIVMIFFTRENEDAVSELYNDNMGLTVELYAERANNIFDRVGVSADTAASLLEIYVVGENSWTKEALDSIVNSSAAYGVVYYKNEASMVTSTGLDTPDVSGYKSSFQGDKHFFHIDDDGISGQSAFVYSIPMKKDANYRGYLLTYI
ncbi:MAG: hypothetical protein LUG83_02610 [Lachnospiraceae bacterium]|nr:hypothetical protein [Lachnospiraceae bacterium]